MALNNNVAGVDISMLNMNDNLNLLSNLNDNYLGPILEDMGIDSKYYNEQDYINLQSVHLKDETLNILSFNIWSLPSKFTNLTIFLDILKNKGIKIDLICLQETYFFMLNCIKLKDLISFIL